MRACDAVVVGGGHNGLVAANYLARAGWDVLVLETTGALGGAVRSEELTRPGFVHDLCATNHNGFLASPVWAELGEDLRRHGLRYAHSDRPFANAFPDGVSLRVYQDAQRTRDELAAHDRRDADGWSELGQLFERYSPFLLGLYQQPLSPRSVYPQVARGLAGLGCDGLLGLGQLLASSTRELGDAFLHTREAKALIACWGMHVDFGPDVAGGALLPLSECLGGEQTGMSIVRGGASRMIEALAASLHAHGGETRTDAPVTRIDVRASRAVGVTLADGETVTARRAILAGVTPSALYGRLLDQASVPAAVRRAASRYGYGPGTLMLHLALDGPVPWTAPELGSFAYVHIGPYLEELAETYTDAANGLLPASPLLVVGQSSVVDPSRAPAGKHVLWVQVRVVPSRIVGDRAGEIATRDWREAGELYADRVLAKLEQAAPGVSDLVLERAVMTPVDLEALDANLVGGDNGAGSHHLRQNVLFRPFPGQSRYRTPVDALWMTGAATWPGAGVTGLPGRLAAQELLEQARGGRRIRRASQDAKGAAMALWQSRRAWRATRASSTWL